MSDDLRARSLVGELLRLPYWRRRNRKTLTFLFYRQSQRTEHVADAFAARAVRGPAVADNVAHDAMHRAWLKFFGFDDLGDGALLDLYVRRITNLNEDER